MKKVIFTFSILGALAFNSFGQACSPNTSSCSPPVATGNPGLTPTPDSLPCFQPGQIVNQIIYFENFNSSSNLPITMNSLRINKIDNLPPGLCWKASKTTFNQGETGCIEVTGTIPTNAPIGQYKLNLDVTINGGIPLDQEGLESLVGLRYFVRVNAATACVCPAIDTMPKKSGKPKIVQDFVAYAPCPAGINDINNNISKLTIKPNPMTSAAVMSFESTVNDNAVVTMTDLLGNVISRKNADILIGNNDITIERNNAAAGVYFVTISSKNGKVSHKLVID